jgi:hypothetical protein
MNCGIMLPRWVTPRFEQLKMIETVHVAPGSASDRRHRKRELEDSAFVSSIDTVEERSGLRLLNALVT